MSLNRTNNLFIGLGISSLLLLFLMIYLMYNLYLVTWVVSTLPIGITLFGDISLNLSFTLLVYFIVFILFCVHISLYILLLKHFFKRN